MTAPETRTEQTYAWTTAERDRLWELLDGDDATCRIHHPTLTVGSPRATRLLIVDDADAVLGWIDAQPGGQWVATSRSAYGLLSLGGGTQEQAARLVADRHGLVLRLDAAVGGAA